MPNKPSDQAQKTHSIYRMICSDVQWLSFCAILNKNDHGGGKMTREGKYESNGVIYILTNPSFNDYVKIGYAKNIENPLCVQGLRGI